MNRRILLLGLVLSSLAPAAVPARADGGSGNSGSGSGNSGSGSGNSGSGSGNSGHGSDNSGSGNDENDGDDDWDSAANAAERGDIAPLPAILKIALSNAPGKVIGVKLRRHGTSYEYRVKILTTSGRKLELSIEARTRIVARIK
jgi:hypothetical protein